MNIGDNIKKIRKEKKLSQSDLAASLEISQSYLSDLENNRKNLGIKTVEKIAKKLDVTTSYLISGNKMLSDLTDNELKEQMFNLSNQISKSTSKNETIVKENLFSLLNKDLSYLDVHYFNNIYNFYELEKTEEDSLLFISV
ncbi:MAG: helix-turn-helix transcriptional regulator, partial [Staphylococcus sp.]|nr:helix-turn-helix transcriptional regulator [Staphylococcus sp.]